MVSGGQRPGPLRDPGAADGAPCRRVAAAADAAGLQARRCLRRRAQGRPAGDGQVLLGALLGSAPPRRRDRHGAGQRLRCRGHVSRCPGRPARTAGTGRGVDRRRALPDAGTDRRPRVATENGVGARVPGVGRRGRGLPARCRGGRHRPLARAPRGDEQARAALGRATSFGRFAHGDLASIADGLAAAPPTAVADAAPLVLEGLPKVAVRSLDDYRRTRR